MTDYQNTSQGSANEEFRDLFFEAEPSIKDWMDKVVQAIEVESTNRFGGFSSKENPIYAIKSRVKDVDSLLQKIQKKNTEGAQITVQNFLWEIKDLAGVRILVIDKEAMLKIDTIIDEFFANGFFRRVEKKIAYQNDPQFMAEFEKRHFNVIQKGYYTSLHYLAASPSDGSLCCEIQVRTIFEDVWAEIDHHYVYKVDATNNTDISRNQVFLLKKIIDAAIFSTACIRSS